MKYYCQSSSSYIADEKMTPENNYLLINLIITYRINYRRRYINECKEGGCW